MIECCLVVVCFCLLHDTNLGPTLPAGGLPAFSVGGRQAGQQTRKQASKLASKYPARPQANEAGKQGLQNHSVKLPRQAHSARSVALAIPSAGNTTTSSWSSLGLICPRVSSEITVEVILCKYSRQWGPRAASPCTLLCEHPAVSTLGRSPRKNCKNDLDDQT